MTDFKAPPLPQAPAFPSAPAAPQAGVPPVQPQPSMAPAQPQSQPQLGVPPVQPQTMVPPIQSAQPAPAQEMPQPTSDMVQPSVSEESSAGLYDNNFAADFNLPPSILTTKMFVVIVSVVCVIGMFLGSMLFGSSSAPAQKSSGLSGVVRNTDITKNLPRCGMTDRGQACILYIVNHTRYDKKAREFFDEAVRLTEVQKYSISIANPKYAEVRIPPGHFVQIQIPNVR